MDLFYYYFFTFLGKGNGAGELGGGGCSVLEGGLEGSIQRGESEPERNGKGKKYFRKPVSGAIYRRHFDHACGMCGSTAKVRRLRRIEERKSLEN